MSVAKNKRDAMMSLLDGSARQDYTPAAFFMHFDKEFHFGEPSVRKHLEYFRYTGMDFVKIQYERTFPQLPEISRPQDWRRMPSYKLEFYEPMLEAVKGLVMEAKKEALVLVTLYSAFMCAGHSASKELLAAHLEEDPEPVRKGFEAINDSLILFVRECARLGVDGFYASTQGGEAGRLSDRRIFVENVKPFDLALMNEINRICPFNILHVCDYHAPYDDLSAYVDYPGQILNCNPQLAGRRLTWPEIAAMFKRPCMGGMDRHGVIASGTPGEIGRAVEQSLREAARPFVLAADCTLPAGTSWDNVRAAIAAAHENRGRPTR